MNELPRADPRWLLARERLQNRYGELSELVDASRLSYLRGPIQHFSEDEFAQIWAEAARDPNRPQNAQHSVYIHVPFCKSICSFCNYERLRPSRPGLLDAWLDRVLQTLDTVAPAVQDLTFHAMYIGGGTPSTLTPRILSRLLEALDQQLNWSKISERAFEFDPAIMNAEKLAVLSRHGFQNFSFGIQTLNADVNADHNRGPQSVEMVARRFEELRAAGIQDVAGDILLGLKGTTPQETLNDIQHILTQFRPLRIDVFQLTPTHEYVNSHFEGSFEAFREHLKPFQETVPDALERFGPDWGYHVKRGEGHRILLRRIDDKHTSRPRGPMGSYQGMTSERDRPVQILGLGPSARSSIFGHASIETRDPGETPLSPGPALYEGHRLDLECEVRAYLVHCLRERNRVERSVFRALFGADIVDLIPATLSAWSSKGWISIHADSVDFVPQSRTERTRALLWLVPDRYLEHEIARRDQLDLSAGGIRHLVRDLSVEQPLAEGVRFSGVADNGRIGLKLASGGTLRLRVAPALAADTPPRVILSEAPQMDAAERKALSQSVARLRALIGRNLASQRRDSKR